MSSQIQITGETKVKSLTGVLVGTSGVVSSVPLGAANGVASIPKIRTKLTILDFMLFIIVHSHKCICSYIIDYICCIGKSKQYLS